jgi:hypothetical protein
LEANTEVAIEFEAVQNILTFIPVLLSECRELVASCYTGNIPPEVIYHMSYSSNNREAADNTLISVLENFDSFIVEFLVPEFFPAFTLYRLDFLPFYGPKSDICYKLSDKPFIAGVGLRNEFFEYSESACSKRESYVVCSQDHVRLRTKARTCAELTLMSSVAALPEECLSKVRVGNCFRQEYIINDGVYYFFSPYEDDIHYRCASFSGKFSVGKGLTMINITECDLQSSEVLIKRKYVDGPVVTLTDDIQIFSTLSDMSKILSELEPIREVSMENDSVLLKKFLRSKDTESVALDAAAVDLRNFRHIEGLANYTVLDFNPSAPLGI